MIFATVLLAALALANAQNFVNQEQAMAMAQQSFDAFRQMILESAQVYSNLPTDGDLTNSEELVVPEPPSQPVSPDRVETMAIILSSLERVIARGSAFYNAGQSDLCARLYFQAVGQIAQVLATMGETDAAAYLADVLGRSSQIASASDAAWFLRNGIEQLVSAVRASPTYAELFAVVDEVRATPDVTCAYGLAVQRVGSELRVYELRCANECDDDLDAADAIFFVEIADGSSSSDDGDAEFEIDFEIDIEIDLVDGDDEEAQPQEPLDREPLYGNDDVATKPLKHSVDTEHKHMLDSSSLLVRCGISMLVFLTLLLLLLTAYRRRQLRMRMRAIAAMEEQQKQRLQRVFGQHGAAGAKAVNVVPMNTPYAAFV